MRLGDFGMRISFGTLSCCKIFKSTIANLQSEVNKGGLRGVEDHPVLTVDAQAERLVALEHGDGAGIEPRRQFGFVTD
jgi:hypothetical protein